MSTYLLLRDHIQLGPYTLEELKIARIQTTDLIWVNGISIAWRFPGEIEELKAFIHPMSDINLNNAEVPNTTLQIQHQKSSNDKIWKNGNDDNPPYKPQELDFQSFENKKKENELHEEENPDAGESNGLVSARYPEMNRSNIIREESSGSRPVQAPGIENLENKTGISTLPKIIKVIIADDHTLFREGVKMALSQKKDIKIVGEAENGMQLLHLLKHNLPDVILLDIQMPVMDGIAALTSIRKSYSDLKVIMLSMYNDRSMVSTLMETGANAYLTKTADSESIYEAIKTCYTKSYYFNDLTNMSMLEKIRSVKKIPGKPLESKFESLSQVFKMPDLQKKEDRLTSRKIRKQLLITTCLILLITSGIIVGISILTHSAPIYPALSQSHKQAEIQSVPMYLPSKAASQSRPMDTARKIKVPVEKIPPLPMIAKTDSNDNPGNVASTKKYLSENDDKKAMVRKKLRNLVTAHTNNYIKDSSSGLSNIELTVYNQTLYKLDLVTVEVQYLFSDSSLYKTETMNFKGIAPLSSKVLEAPNSSMGERIEYQIITVKSKELGL